MFHEGIDAATAQGLTVLRQRIDKAGIPPSKLDETLNIATWNIRAFGKKKRLEPSIHYIAEIISQFDLVAVVELADDLEDLKRVLSVLGPYWKAVFSDFNTDAAGNRERIGLVYDQRAAVPTGLYAEADPVKTKVKVSPGHYEYRSAIEWWRSPYMVSFRAGHFDFAVLVAHIRWGEGVKDRSVALASLADWVDARHREPFVVSRDMLVMGDFNVTTKNSQTFKAITRRGLEVPPPLLKADVGSNLAKAKRYDQILHYPLHKEVYADREGHYRTAGGVLDFYEGAHAPLYPGRTMSKEKFTFELSDHLPLWMQLNTWYSDVELAQMVAKGKKAGARRARATDGAARVSPPRP